MLPLEPSRGRRYRCPAPRFVVSALLAAALAGTVRAQEATLLASDGALDDRFGSAVDLSGDTAVVGAPLADTFGLDSGTAYVFVRAGSTWTEQGRLTPLDGQPSDQFGTSVAVDGDTAIVGAICTDDLGASSGSAYVFVRSGTTWSQQAKLLALDGAVGDFLGQSVDLWGDYAVVGAPLDDDAMPGDPNAQSGAAYVFLRVGTLWVQQQKVLPADLAVNDLFGAAVTIHGGRLAVGAPQDQDLGVDTGAVYVFARFGTTWMEEAKLVPADGAANDQFGGAVSLHDRTLAAGAIGADQAAPGAGAAYVYRRTGFNWNQEDKVVDLAPATGDRFGGAVGVFEDRLVVGAPLNDAAGMDAGRACVFQRSAGAWLHLQTLVPAGAVAGDQLGDSVSTDRGRVLAGAPLRDDNGFMSGAGYVFLDPSVQTYCVGKTNSLGCVPFISTSGLPSATSTLPFQIAANSVLDGESGILIYGLSKANLNFHGGKLCVNPFIRTLPPKAAKSSGAPPCTGVLVRDFNNRIQSGVDPLLSVGQRIRAQWEQRDPLDPAGFGDSLSDAVQFTIGP